MKKYSFFATILVIVFSLFTSNLTSAGTNIKKPPAKSVSSPSKPLPKSPGEAKIDSLEKLIAEQEAREVKNETPAVNKITSKVMSAFDSSLASSKAIIKREAGWHREVRPLSVSQSLAWATSAITDQEKQERLQWLSRRWSVNQPDITKNLRDQSYSIQSEMEAKAKLRAQITGVVNKTVPTLVGKYLTDQNFSPSTISDILKRLDALDQKQTLTTEDLNALVMKVTVHDSTLTSHGARLSGFEERISRIEPNLDKAWEFLARVKLNKDPVKSTQNEINRARDQ